MTYLLKWLFFPNWEEVWVADGVWNIHSEFGKYNENCYYKIYWSRVRRKYKLSLYGYRPQFHKLHTVALNELMRLRKEAPVRY